MSDVTEVSLFFLRKSLKGYIDVGDKICWWQLLNVVGFGHFGHQQNCHRLEESYVQIFLTRQIRPLWEDFCDHKVAQSVTIFLKAFSDQSVKTDSNWHIFNSLFRYWQCRLYRAMSWHYQFQGSIWILQNLLFVLNNKMDWCELEVSVGMTVASEIRFKPRNLVQTGRLEHFQVFDNFIFRTIYNFWNVWKFLEIPSGSSTVLFSLRLIQITINVNEPELRGQSKFGPWNKISNKKGPKSLLIQE